jgi:phospholipid-translocating ATPase
MVSPYEEENEVSNPVKRIRWATRRITGMKGDNKRSSLLDRVHKRTPSKEKPGSKRTSAAGTDPDFFDAEDGEESSEDGGDGGRRLFFNVPLPDDARDEDGHPLAHFTRNKIRTAKYTPISFIPKNLWFQFHNIANVYFLFIIILGVSEAFQSLPIAP